MSSHFSGIIKLLMGSREGVIPSVQAFPPLDIDQIASELDIEARAKENGQLNLPSTDSDVEDAAELDILAEIKRQASKAREEYHSQMELYDDRARPAFAGDEITLIDAAGESALSDFKVLAVNDFSQLFNTRLEAEGRKREFDEFRKTHNLVRLPNVVSSREWWFRGLLLAIFVVLESTLNGLFFAKGSETGLIGGIVQAFVLSILNVGAAVLYARYCLPLVVHTRPIIRTAGGITTVFYALWAIGINLLIGHFRDLFTQNAGEVKVTDLLSRVWNASLFLPADAQSLLLVALGVLLSLVSLIDAAGMDDLYPGYGSVGKRRADAVSDYVDRKSRCLADLTQRKDSAIEDMSRVINLMKNTEFEFRMAIEGRKRLHQNYRAYLSHLSESYVRLLQLYRESNTRARSTQPPARFKRVSIPKDFLSEPPPPVLPDLAGDSNSKKQIIERMQHFIKVVNQQFVDKLQHYQTVTRLTEEEAKRDVDA